MRVREAVRRVGGVATREPRRLEPPRRVARRHHRAEVRRRCRVIALVRREVPQREPRLLNAQRERPLVRLARLRDVAGKPLAALAASAEVIRAGARVPRRGDAEYRAASAASRRTPVSASSPRNNKTPISFADSASPASAASAKHRAADARSPRLASRGATDAAAAACPASAASTMNASANCALPSSAARSADAYLASAGPFVAYVEGIVRGRGGGRGGRRNWKETTGVRARATRGARAARGARARAARGPSPDARGGPRTRGRSRGRAFSGGVGARPVGRRGGRGAATRGVAGGGRSDAPRRRAEGRGDAPQRRSSASAASASASSEDDADVGARATPPPRPGGARARSPSAVLTLPSYPIRRFVRLCGEPVVELRRALAGLAKVRDGRARGAIGARARLDVRASSARGVARRGPSRGRPRTWTRPRGSSSRARTSRGTSVSSPWCRRRRRGGGGAPAHRARRRASERQVREGERRATRPRARVANEAAGAGARGDDRESAPPSADARRACASPREPSAREGVSPPRRSRPPRNPPLASFRASEATNKFEIVTAGQTTTRSRHLRLWTTPPPPARSRTPSPRAVASRRVS